MGKKNKELETIAYFLYEGDTEEEFYKSVINKYVSREIKRSFKNLDGGSGINKEVAKYVSWFLSEHQNSKVNVYVFIDREGPRSKIPEFNSEAILNALIKYYDKNTIGRIEKIEAIQMIESWFLYDLESICTYIGLPISKSLKSKYCTPEKFNNKDLSELFSKGRKGRRYRKGDKNFLKCLDIDIIYSKCNELMEGITTINNDFK